MADRWERFKSAFGAQSDLQKYHARRTKVANTLADVDQIVRPAGGVAPAVSKGSANDRLLADLVAKSAALWLKLLPPATTPPNASQAYKALDDVLKDAQKLLKAAQAVRNVHTPLGTKINVQMMEGFGKMSQAEQDAALKEVDARKLRGKETLDAVLGKTTASPPHKPTLKDVGDVMWHLRLSAEEVAEEAFKKGAITVPDPTGKIQAWLDKCAEVYIRDSSHLKDDNRKTGRAEDQKVAGQAPRGIDFYPDRKKGDAKRDASLPYGMSTLLYQSFERNGQRMLYIKTETEGGYIEGDKHKGALKRTGNPKADDQVDSRKMRRTDIGDTLAHGLNYFSKKSETGGLSRHGETGKDLPADVVSAYTRILDHVHGSPLLKTLVGKDVDTLVKVATDKKGRQKFVGEVQQMAANIESAHVRLAGLRNDPNCPADVRAQVDQLIQELFDWIDVCEDVGWALDTLDVRLGNEVVLTGAEI